MFNLGFRAYNSFARVLLDIEAGTEDSSLFARGCAHIFETHDFDSWAYPYIQVFEPNSLYEIAHLNGLDLERVEELGEPKSASARRLRDLTMRPGDLSDVWLANTIGALISIAHFQAAQTLMAHFRLRDLTVQGQFERAWLAFLITNRCEQGIGMRAAFDEMRAAAETNQVSSGRVLDLCTQGVVWHLKCGQIDEQRFRWCLTTGAMLSDHVEGRIPETAASWYRGLAMLPAAHKDVKRTRAYMYKAEQNARMAISQEPKGGVAALNQLKTFHESSIKEFMYVDPDLDRALISAQALVELDPYWPLSLAELGEVHAHFGYYEPAAQCFEQAAALGPPHVASHLLQAANARARIGDRETMLNHAATLRAIAPDEEALAKINQVCA